MNSEEMKTKDHTEWHGEYKGVHWEIVKWKGYENYIWNAYINVKPRKNKYTTYAGRENKCIEYSKMYRDVSDMVNGGLTYMCEITSSWNMGKIHKIGWDYNHSWDRENGHSHDLESIKYDVKNVIDNLPEDLFFK